MGEIGSGNNSSYPGALDTNSIPEINSPAAGKTKARKEPIEDLTDAVIKIETELGTDPAGSLTDVKTFLQTQHQTDGTHKSTHGPHKWLDEQDYANFTAAIAAAANKTLVVARSINLDANTTIPASVSLMPINPGIINANGYTLTINGSVVGDPMHQWLSGFAAGEVTFGALKPNSKIEAAWFGYTGDGTTNDRTAGQVAINACPNHCDLHFHGRGHIGTPANISLDHSAVGGAASSNYLGIWSIVGKEGIRITGNFTEAASPVGYSWYWLFVIQNCQDMNFDIEMEGYIDLSGDNDSDTSGLASNDLDQHGGIVALISDRCKRIHIDVKGKKLHGGVWIQPYDAANTYFTARYWPDNITGNIQLEDTVYGVNILGADNTYFILNGVNMKRIYRCHGGDTNLFDASHTTKEKDSFGSSADGCISIRPNQPGGTLKNVQGRICMSGGERTVLIGVYANTSALTGVKLDLAMESGRLLIYNALSSPNTGNIFDVNITGFLHSTNSKPIEIQATNYTSSTSTIRRVRFHDFTLYSNHATGAVIDPISFRKFTGDTTQYYHNFTFNNVYIEAYSNNGDENSDGYNNGSLVFRRINGLEISNLRHVVGGTYTETDSVVFEDCNDIKHFGIQTPAAIKYANSEATTTDYYGISGKNSTSSLMTLDIDIEQTVEAIGTFTASDKFRVWINGVEYYIQLDAV